MRRQTRQSIARAVVRHEFDRMLRESQRRFSGRVAAVMADLDAGDETRSGNALTRAAAKLDRDRNPPEEARDPRVWVTGVSADIEGPTEVQGRFRFGSGSSS